MVSAGVLITGALWYGRMTEAVRGEDIAALYAALTERAIVAYHTGDGGIEWPTNHTVRAFAENSVFRGAVLDGLRAMATNEPEASGIRVWWISPPQPGAEFDWPSDGGEFAACETAWRQVDIETNYVGTSAYYRVWYEPDAASNAVCPFLTTSTRVLPATRVWPGTSPTNIPLPLVLFPHASPDPAVMFPTGHWFTAVNTNGLRAYKYGSEKWVGVDGETIGIRAVAGDGAGFAADPDELEFGWLDTDPKTAALDSLSSATNLMLSALYEVHADGRNSAWFAVTDAESSGLTPNLVVSPKKLALGEGGKKTFTVRPRDAIPSGVSHTAHFTAYGGVDVNVVPFGTGFNVDDYLFTANNWNTPVTIYVAALDNGLPGNSAGLIGMEYRGETAWLAVEISDNGDEGAADLTADPVLVSVGKLGSGSVDISAAVATNIRISASSQIRRDDLDEARSGLTNLFRTVAWVPFGELRFSNAVETVWGVVNETTNLVYSEEATSEGLWDALVALLSESVSSGPYYETNPVLATATLSVELEQQVSFFNTDPPDTDYDADGYLLGSFTARQYSGCSLPYPSDAAVTNGYVRKISVYAVAEGAELGLAPYCYGITVATNFATRTDSFTSYNATPDAFSALHLGALSHIALFSDTVVPAPPAGTFDQVSYDKAVNRPGVEAYRMAHLATVSDPSSPDGKHFTLGTDSLAELSESWALLPRGVQETVITWVEYGDTDTWTFDTAAADQTVTVLGFLVFVEWNWVHENPAAPFTPATHTPEWITANTNAP